MKKLLLMAMGLLWLQTAEAQFLKKLTDKVKDKVSNKINRKIDDKVNQTIEKTTNKAEKILTDTASRAKREGKKEQLADTLSADTTANHNLINENRKKKISAAKHKAKSQ